MSDLPPQKSYGGDWASPNKVPYTGNWGNDIKPPRRSRKMQGCLIWFLIACAAAIFLAYVTSR